MARTQSSVQSVHTVLYTAWHFPLHLHLALPAFALPGAECPSCEYRSTAYSLRRVASVLSDFA
jgi:hypothetical protein